MHHDAREAAEPAALHRCDEIAGRLLAAVVEMTRRRCPSGPVGGVLDTGCPCSPALDGQRDHAAAPAYRRKTRAAQLPPKPKVFDITLSTDDVSSLSIKGASANAASRLDGVAPPSSTPFSIMAIEAMASSAPAAAGA